MGCIYREVVGRMTLLLVQKLVLIVVCWSLSTPTPCHVYLRDRSAQPARRSATLRSQLLFKLAVSQYSDTWLASHRADQGTWQSSHKGTCCLSCWYDNQGRQGSILGFPTLRQMLYHEVIEGVRTACYSGVERKHYLTDRSF